MKKRCAQLDIGMPGALYIQMTQSEFEHTLLQMRERLIRVALDFFRNRQDAEDVVQEVYVRMLKRGWKPGDNVEALVIRATKNLCVSVWRRQRSKVTESLEGHMDAMGYDNADNQILSQERQSQIESAIKQLPPSEQNLIKMKQQEMNLEEMSQQTGFAHRTISTMLCSAKKRLKILLKENRI